MHLPQHVVVTYPDTAQPHKPRPAANGIQQRKLQGDVAPVGLGDEPVEGLLLEVIGILKSALLRPQDLHRPGKDQSAKHPTKQRFTARWAPWTSTRG